MRIPIRLHMDKEQKVTKSQCFFVNGPMIETRNIGERVRRFDSSPKAVNRQ